MQVKPLETLPLFAWAARVIGEAFVEPPFAPEITGRRERQKPPPPPASEIWINRPSDIPAEIAVAALLEAWREARTPTVAAIDPVAHALITCPKIAKAIGRPDLTPPSMQFQSAAWVARLADRVAVELAYQGPKEHLAEAVDAIARLARDLGLIARTATAQFSPLRADTAQRGAIGWRVKVAMVKPVEAPRAVIRKPENALSL